MKWQPIETAPMDGTPVLVFGDDLNYPCEAYWEPRSCTMNILVGWYSHESMRQGWLCHDGSPDAYGSMDPTQINPTHWMPLPEPPTAPRT